MPSSVPVSSQTLSQNFIWEVWFYRQILQWTNHQLYRLNQNFPDTWLSNVPYILITCTFTMIMCGLWFSYQLNSLKSNLMVRKFDVWILIWFFHYICVFPSAYPCTLYWLKVLLVKDGTEQWRRKGKQKKNQSSPRTFLLGSYL